MKKSIYSSCARALSVAALSCTLFGALPAIAQEGGAASQLIEPVRVGIPHDSLFALEMQGEWGLATGNFGLVLETKDGGATWTAVDSKTTLGLLGAKRVDDHLIAVGQQGFVMTRTGDGEWTHVKSGLTQRLMNVDMNASGLAIVIGEFGFVARSRDFGATWEPITMTWTDYNDEGYEPHLYDVIVTGEGAVMVSGEFGLILRSDDSGDTWRAVNKGSESVFAMQLANDGSNTGYAVGQQGLVLKTTDNGLTWQKLDSGTNANLLGVWSGNSEVVITGIRQLLRSSDDGATFTGAAADDFSIVRTWFQSVAASVVPVKTGERGFFGEQKVYIVGHRGTIARVLK